MKYQFLVVALFFYCFSVFSQEIAIPYHDGDKWGICNEEGKLLIDPKYDKIDFYQDYNTYHEMLIPKIKDKRGLIVNGKLIFDAVYDNIYENNGNYVLIKTENNSKATDIVNKEGKSILEKPIIEIIETKNLRDNSNCFHVLNKDLTESLFILNSKDNTLVWLYENYYSLKLLKKQNDYKSITFLIKKTENDPLITESWDFNKLPNEKIKSKTFYRSENDYLARFTEKTYNYNSKEGGSGTGNGLGSRQYNDEVVEIKGDSNYDVVVEAPREGMEGSSKKKVAYYSNAFKIQNDKLIIERLNYNENKDKSTIPVNLKIDLKDIEIKPSYFSTSKNDTINTFQNYIQYKKKDKIGVLFSSKTNNLVEFDTILKKIGSISDYSYNNEIIFIVGNKEKKTNKFKYSFYSNAKGLLFPLQFDELTPLKVTTNQGSSITFLSKLDTKFGIVQMNGQEVLKPEFDEIKEQPYSSSGNGKMLFQLKKNNKYGLIIQYNINYKLKVIDAIFDYQIKEVITDYPKLEYKKNDTSNQTPKAKITLLSLKNKNGNLVGYANANGILYFKN